MIGPDQVEADLAHERQIFLYLFGMTEIVAFCVRLERSIGNAFNKKLPVTFKEKFRDRADPRVCAHTGNFLVQVAHRSKGFRWEGRSAKILGTAG